MTFRMGIDIGGTFTDFALVDGRTGRLAVHKQLTTPDDPSRAVLEGVKHLAAKENIRVRDLTAIVHGSTLVTNSVIERRGAVTGMLVTAGFRSVLDIGIERRYDLFDLKLRFPSPLVPFELRRELRERMRSDGSVETPLALDDVRAAVSDLVDTYGVESLALCFLHSYRNPAHELAAAELIAREFPKLYVSVSSSVYQGMREFERWTTATVNAFTQPVVDRYLTDIESGLQGAGFSGSFTIVTSSGGAVTPNTARQFPVRMLESGPAAGALMAAYLGRQLGWDRLLSFDMGGTTAKGALIRDGAPIKRYDFEVARIHEFKQGSGLPLKIPTIDMIEIGSGGGSIAAIDDRGVIRAGPRSAGAMPGPTCYGRGGAKPTLTDADLVLGYLDADYFLGGDMKLDVSAAQASLIDDVGARLDLDATRAAWGVHATINEDVSRAFRVHASERGFDYRGCAMVAFGGSGPLHAVRIARKLRIPKVLFPAGAGVASALGMLISPLAFEVVRSFKIDLDELDAGMFSSIFSAMAEEASNFLMRAGVRRDDIDLYRALDMRYIGQGYEIEVPVPTTFGEGNIKATLRTLFSEAYRTVFSGALDEKLEIMTWKLEAKARNGSNVDVRHLGEASDGAQSARKGSRAAYFPELGGFVDCPVYDRYALRIEQSITGPALIEEREATCLIGPGDRATIDLGKNILVEINGIGDDNDH